MAKFVILGNWTDQGVKTAKDSVERSHQAAAMVEKAGGKMTSILWTIGQYDFISIVEAPNDEAVVSVLLKLAGAGNVRTQTLRAFDESDMAKILGGI